MCRDRLGGEGEEDVLKRLALEYDAAVMDAVKKLPRFEPGMQDKMPVAVSFTVPVSFAE